MNSTTNLRFHTFDWFLDNSTVLMATLVFGSDLQIIAFNFIKIN